MPKGREEKENYPKKEKECIPKVKGNNTTIPNTAYASQDITPLHWIP